MLTDTTASDPEARTIESLRARALLSWGAAAGPVLTSVVAVQATTREGFDLRHQPLSLLSLGDLGWVQVTNFLVAGLLTMALARGLHLSLRTGVGRTWAPVLMAVFGVGLVAGGLFLPDPALGYPPGTPDAVPDRFSWHGALHAVAPPLAFTALVACCLVLSRRFARQGRRGWAAYSAATSALALVLTAWPSQDGVSVRLAAAVVLGFVWTTALALDLRSSLGADAPHGAWQRARTRPRRGSR